MVVLDLLLRSSAAGDPLIVGHFQRELGMAREPRRDGYLREFLRMRRRRQRGAGTQKRCCRQGHQRRSKFSRRPLTAPGTHREEAATTRRRSRLRTRRRPLRPDPVAAQSPHRGRAAAPRSRTRDTGLVRLRRSVDPLQCPPVRFHCATSCHDSGHSRNTSRGDLVMPWQRSGPACVGCGQSRAS